MNEIETVKTLQQQCPLAEVGHASEIARDWVGIQVSLGPQILVIYQLEGQTGWSVDVMFDDGSGVDCEGYQFDTYWEAIGFLVGQYMKCVASGMAEEVDS